MYSVAVISTTRHVINSFNSLELWEKNKFTLKSITDNVDTAMKPCPDVVICPVKSAEADGCALAKKVKENNLKTKVILYGRKTYESVKSAIDSGAFGYLSMPLDVGELEDLLKRLKKDIRKEQMNLSNFYSGDEDIGEIRAEYFTSMLNEEYDKEYFGEKFKNLNFNVKFERVSLGFVSVTIENYLYYVDEVWKYEKESLYNAVYNFIEKTAGELLFVPLNHKEDKIYIVILKEKTFVSEYQFSDIAESIKNIMGIKVSFETVKQFKSIEDFIDYKDKKQLLETFELERKESGTASETVVMEAKKYINHAYFNEISLNDVADYVGLSAAYFSRIFKSETGEKFVDYLVKIRMEKAKKLFEMSKYKTYEISEIVGYKKSKYFGKLFKNYTGYTPTEYRSMLRKKNKIKN